MRRLLLSGALLAVAGCAARAEAVVWEDARTHFQLNRIGDEIPTVTASLCDRAELD